MEIKNTDITQDAAERIMAADFKNIVKKVREGKPLSQAELSRVQARAVGAANTSLTTAGNLTELASALGVTRQSIHRWRKMENAPLPAGNGLHSVFAWRQFMAENGLEGGTATTDMEALKARKLLADIEDRELRLALRKGEYVALEEVRLEWTTQVGKAIALMRAKFESELPPILSGLDAYGIQRELSAAIDEVCNTLHNGGKCTP